MTEFTISKQLITPKQVNEWENKGAMTGKVNRPLRLEWVSYLAAQMRGEKFEPTNTIAFAHVNGETFLVNGQHTLHAIRESNEPQSLAVAHYKLSDSDSLSSLYTKYDIGAKRNFYDALRAHNLIDRTGLIKYEIEKLGSAVKFIANSFGRTPSQVDHEEWLHPMLHYAPMMRLWVNVMNGCDRDISPRMYSRGVLAVALVTLEYQESKALSYWRSIVQDDGLKKTDPAKHARRFLEKYGFVGGNSNRLDVMQAESYARVMAHLWNKAYDNQNLSVLYYNKVATSPITIHGTIYASGAHVWPVDGKGVLNPPF